MKRSGWATLAAVLASATLFAVTAAEGPAKVNVEAQEVDCATCRGRGWIEDGHAKKGEPVKRGVCRFCGATGKELIIGGRRTSAPATKQSTLLVATIDHERAARMVAAAEKELARCKEQLAEAEKNLAAAQAALKAPEAPKKPEPEAAKDL